MHGLGHDALQILKTSPTERSSRYFLLSQETGCALWYGAPEKRPASSPCAEHTISCHSLVIQSWVPYCRLIAITPSVRVPATEKHRPIPAARPYPPAWVNTMHKATTPSDHAAMTAEI